MVASHLAATCPLRVLTETKDEYFLFDFMVNLIFAWSILSSYRGIGMEVGLNILWSWQEVGIDWTCVSWRK